MATTLKAYFNTRREAETAIEHLVQDHGLPREAVFVAPEGAANSAGLEEAGSDVASHPQNTDNANAPALKGRLELTVEVGDGDLAKVEQYLRETGAEEISRGSGGLPADPELQQQS